MSAAITVCIPVYNAAAFLAETLDSVAAQKFRAFKVLISLDESTDDSEKLCRRALGNSRFELIVQPTRLGWVGNVNALIERVATPYFCIVPHDDLLDPRYLSEVYALIASDSAIACAYSDISGFGDTKRLLAQPEIRGGPLSRVLDFLLNHFNAIAFRGLIRRRGPDDRPYLPANLTDDHAADTVWMLHLALRGELRRVPENLYAKRYHAESVHSQWPRKERAELVRLWAEQAVVSAEIALTHLTDSWMRDIVLMASFMRATAIGKIRRNYMAPRNPMEIVTAATIFGRAFPELPQPEDWDGVLARPDARLLRTALAEATRR